MKLVSLQVVYIVGGTTATTLLTDAVWTSLDKGLTWVEIPSVGTALFATESCYSIRYTQEANLVDGVQIYNREISITTGEFESPYTHQFGLYGIQYFIDISFTQASLYIGFMSSDIFAGLNSQIVQSPPSNVAQCTSLLQPSSACATIGCALSAFSFPYIPTPGQASGINLYLYSSAADIFTSPLAWATVSIPAVDSIDVETLARPTSVYFPDTTKFSAATIITSKSYHLCFNVVGSGSISYNAFISPSVSIGTTINSPSMTIPDPNTNPSLYYVNAHPSLIQPAFTFYLSSVSDSFSPLACTNFVAFPPVTLFNYYHIDTQGNCAACPYPSVSDGTIMDSSDCLLCPEDTYPVFSTGSCAQCPAGTSSPVGSSGISDCINTYSQYAVRLALYRFITINISLDDIGSTGGDRRLLQESGSGLTYSYLELLAGSNVVTLQVAAANVPNPAIATSTDYTYFNGFDPNIPLDFTQIYVLGLLVQGGNSTFYSFPFNTTVNNRTTNAFTPATLPVDWNAGIPDLIPVSNNSNLAPGDNNVYIYLNTCNVTDDRCVPLGQVANVTNTTNTIVGGPTGPLANALFSLSVLSAVDNTYSIFLSVILTYVNVMIYDPFIHRYYYELTDIEGIRIIEYAPGGGGGGRRRLLQANLEAVGSSSNTPILCLNVTGIITGLGSDTTGYGFRFYTSEPYLDTIGLNYNYQECGYTFEDNIYYYSNNASNPFSPNGYYLDAEITLQTLEFEEFPSSSGSLPVLSTATFNISTNITNTTNLLPVPVTTATPTIGNVAVSSNIPLPPSSSSSSLVKPLSPSSSSSSIPIRSPSSSSSSIPRRLVSSSSSSLPILPPSSSSSSLPILAPSSSSSSLPVHTPSSSSSSLVHPLPSSSLPIHSSSAAVVVPPSSSLQGAAPLSTAVPLPSSASIRSSSTPPPSSSLSPPSSSVVVHSSSVTPLSSSLPPPSSSFPVHSSSLPPPSSSPLKSSSVIPLSSSLPSSSSSLAVPSSSPAAPSSSAHFPSSSPYLSSSSSSPHSPSISSSLIVAPTSSKGKSSSASSHFSTSIHPSSSRRSISSSSSSLPAVNPNNTCCYCFTSPTLPILYFPLWFLTELIVNQNNPIVTSNTGATCTGGTFDYWDPFCNCWRSTWIDLNGHTQPNPTNLIYASGTSILVAPLQLSQWPLYLILVETTIRLHITCTTGPNSCIQFIFDVFDQMPTQRLGRDANNICHL